MYIYICEYYFYMFDELWWTWGWFCLADTGFANLFSMLHKGHKLAGRFVSFGHKTTEDSCQVLEERLEVEDAVSELQVEDAVTSPVNVLRASDRLQTQ